MNKLELIQKIKDYKLEDFSKVNLFRILERYKEAEKTQIKR